VSLSRWQLAEGAVHGVCHRKMTTWPVAKLAPAAGRPISRDNLRAQLRIGRDRASALVAVVRAEAAGEPRTLPQAA
jgi:hypothetical protein